MKSDFSQPQYQSRKGIVILALISFGKIIRNFWFFIIYLFYKNGSSSLPLMVLVSISLLILVLFNAWFKYHYFTYQIDFENDKFIIKKGIVNKKTILLEKNKIQEVNINQPFIHRLLRIYQLEIDSPGTEKNEITINAVSLHDAQFLQNFLLAKNEIQAEEKTFQQSTPADTLKIGVGSIIKYAFSANYLKSFVALTGFIFYIHHQVAENFAVDLADYLPGKNVEQNWKLLSIFTIIAIFFILAVAGIMINVIRTVFVYFNLKLSKFETYFAMEYGLFNTKNQIINKNKVQLTTLSQNYFQRWGDVLQLQFHQIGGADSKNNQATVPGCNGAEKDDLLNFIYGKNPVFTAHILPNFRFIISRTVIFIMVPLLTVFFIGTDAAAILPFAIFYSIFAAALIYFSFRNSRLSFNDRCIQKQEGIWDVEQKTFEMEKIQALKISQFFWQKKSGLATVYFTTAGGTVKMSTADKKNLKNLMNFALYKVESSPKSWM